MSARSSQALAVDAERHTPESLAAGGKNCVADRREHRRRTRLSGAAHGLASGDKSNTIPNEAASRGRFTD